MEMSKRAVATTRNVIDIAYGPDYWQRLDVFLPPAAAQNAVSDTGRLALPPPRVCNTTWLLSVTKR